MCENQGFELKNQSLNPQKNQGKQMKVQFSGYENIYGRRAQPSDHELKNLEHNSGNELPNSDEVSKTTCRLETVIRWENLNFEINVKGKKKKILNNVSGEINNLNLMCILGPSGAGKSTLLNTIAGHMKKYTGSVKFFTRDKKITFAYVTQENDLIPQLTVKEVLLFASKLKNSSQTNHSKETKDMLSALNLWNSRNHRTSKCSGGEKKRLCIACEMIGRPKILILDEPTTGLDSTTSYILIDYLKALNKNTTVLATIHQPNSKLFQIFDRCYFLTEGKCIYDGSPLEIVNHLKANFKIICEDWKNPADLILDIANDVKSVEGLNLIESLANYEREKKSNEESDINSKSFVDSISGKFFTLEEVDRSSFNTKSRFLVEYYEISKRLLTGVSRDPLQFLFRVFANIIFPCGLCFIMKTRIGLETGCSFMPQNETHAVTENAHEQFDRRLIGLQNAVLLFINMMYIVFISMVPATLMMSQYINLLKREYLNSYYTLHSFYSAAITTNFVLSLVYSFANTASLFYFSTYSFQIDKFLLFWLIVFLLSNIGDLLGTFLAICYPEEKNKATACVLSSLGSIVLHVYSGFFVGEDVMKDWVKTFNWYIFCHHATAAAIKILYGNRCAESNHLVLGFDSLNNFVKQYNVGKEHKLEYINDISLKSEKALKEHPWNKTAIFDIIQLTNNLEDDDVNKLEVFWNRTSNWVLDTYHLPSADSKENFSVLLATTLVLLTICYLTLIFKIRK